MPGCGEILGIHRGCLVAHRSFASIESVLHMLSTRLNGVVEP